MFVFRLCSVFILLSAFHTVLSSCNKSIAAQLEDELRELLEISMHNLTLYDSGDVLQWNCTDDEDHSSVHQNTSSSQEEQAGSYVSPVAVGGFPENNGIFVTSSSGNSTRLNTFVLIYKNIFDSQKDESFAPSSNVPVQIVANVTEEATTLKPLTGVTATPVPPAQYHHRVESNTTKKNEVTPEQSDTKNVTLSQDQKGSSHSVYNTPVNILLGEKHGITILNATYPEKSIFVNKTDIDAFGIDYKYATGTIIFSGNGAIRSTGQPSTLVTAGVDGPVRLAVDWVHDRLYWLSDTHQTVEAVDLDGSNRTLLTDVIHGIKFPNNINVDPYQRLLFFVANNTVYRCDLEGRNLVRIDPEDSTPKAVRCLTLDIPSKRLFFSGTLDASPRRPYIASSDYDGGAVKYLNIGNTDWNDVYSMDVFRDVLYFAHYNPKLPDSVWLFNTSWKGKRPVCVYEAPSSRGGIWSIKVFHSQAQEQSDKLGE